MHKHLLPPPAASLPACLPARAGSKSLGPIGKHVRAASSTLDREGAAIVAALAADKKDAGLVALEGLKQASQLGGCLGAAEAGIQAGM